MAGHPLAIVIAASIAHNERMINLKSLKCRFYPGIAQIPKVQEMNPEELSLKVSLDISYDLLGAVASKLLPRLSIFAGYFREEAVAVIGSDLQGWKQALIELMEFSLLEKHEFKMSDENKVQFFTLHPIVRSFAAEKLVTNKDLHLQVGRYLVNTRFTNEILEGIRHLEVGEAWDEVIQAVWKIEDYLDISGLWTDDELILEAGIKAARSTANRTEESHLLSELGSNTLRRGDARKALDYFDKALTIAKEIKDKGGEIIDLGNLGNVYSNLGELRKAIEYHERALVIAIEIGDRKGEERGLGSLGNVYSNLGELRKAIEYHERALVIAKEIGDKRGEGSILGNLGNTFARLGELRKSIEYHERALVIAKEIGDKQGEERGLGNLGNVYSNLGELRKAVEYHERALVIAKEIGDKRGEGSILGNLGNTFARLGELRKSIEYHERALVIAKEIGDKQGEGSILGNLGLSYAMLDKPDKGLAFLNEGFLILKSIESPDSQKIAWHIDRLSKMTAAEKH